MDYRFIHFRELRETSTVFTSHESPGLMHGQNVRIVSGVVGAIRESPKAELRDEVADAGFCSRLCDVKSAFPCRAAQDLVIRTYRLGVVQVLWDATVTNLLEQACRHRPGAWDRLWMVCRVQEHGSHG